MLTNTFLNRRNILIYLGIIVVYSIFLFNWVSHQEALFDYIDLFFVGGPIISTFVYLVLCLPFSRVKKWIVSLIIIAISIVLTDFLFTKLIKQVIYDLTNDGELAAFSYYIMFTLFSLSLGVFSVRMQNKRASKN